MKFIHNETDFADLIRIVALGHTPPIGAPLVEKDYWVTHTLWSVQQWGLECWFKGGTSLSKGFGLIQRFSEDLDLKLGVGTVNNLPAVENWKSDGKKHIATRNTFFEAIAHALPVSGASVELNAVDEKWRSAELRIIYPSVLGERMPEPMKSFVLIEAGNARVVPSISRDLSSFVHDGLATRDLLHDFCDNRPRALSCVHPLVTLIEKLDAISNRFGRESAAASTFVRHYEDAARVIDSLESLPEVREGLQGLLADMVQQRDIRRPPLLSDPAFTPSNSPRWSELLNAYEQTKILFFGSTMGLDAACQRIRDWIATIAP